MEFFGTLSKEWALECMKDLLLVNLRGNLQIIVQVGQGVPDVVLYIFPIFHGFPCACPYVIFEVCSNVPLKNHAICRLLKNIVNTWVSKLALSSLSSSNHMKDCISS